MTQLLIADPIPVFRAGVRACLRREPDFVVSEADDRTGLLDLAERVSPDVVLVDSLLPPDGGIDAVRRVSERLCGCVAIWSLDADFQTVIAAVRAGASGWVAKDLPPESLIRALRALARGEAVLPRPVQTAVVEDLRRAGRLEHARERAAALTPREEEVLSLISRGARNRELAAELQISEFTVKRHVQKILRKLEVGSRRDAAVFYRTARGEPAPARGWTP